MQEIGYEVIEKLMQRVRVGESAADELEDLAKTCIRELEMSGVYGSVDDPTYLHAIVLYCKANYGYDEKTERFKEAFESLKNAMALSGDYEKGN